MKIELLLGDITKIKHDVIVNSANRSLMRGGGICGAIHKVAGIELEKECMEFKEKNKIDFLSIGDAVLTNAHNLPAKHVIHTVGPKNNGKDDITLLKNCYINSIKLADKIDAKSVCFPAIATNIYGVPIEASAKMVKEVLNSIEKPKNIEKISLIFTKQSDIDIYAKIFKT